MTCCKYQGKLNSRTKGAKKKKSNPMNEKSTDLISPQTINTSFWKTLNAYFPPLRSTPDRRNKMWNLKCGEDQTETNTLNECAHVESSRWIRRFTPKTKPHGRDQHHALIFHRRKKNNNKKRLCNPIFISLAHSSPLLVQSEVSLSLRLQHTRSGSEGFRDTSTRECILKGNPRRVSYTEQIRRC